MKRLELIINIKIDVDMEDGEIDGYGWETYIDEKECDIHNIEDTIMDYVSDKFRDGTIGKLEEKA